MTATQTPCLPETDRFQRAVNVPDPPATPAGRRAYWDDTVMEALGELRRRLASDREAVATQALLAILDLEKHKMRHGRPVSGTEVPYLGEVDQPSSPILQNRAEPPSPNAGTETPHPHGPILENQATSVPPAPPSATSPPDLPDFSHLTPEERDFAERNDEIAAGVQRVAERVFLPLLNAFARAARPVRARRRTRSAGRWPPGWAPSG